MVQKETSDATSRKAPVLVVDDDKSLRNLMTRWLAASGYQVDAAATAEEALDKQHRNPAAVALCDVRLPGHDGFWLANQLRHDTPETAIIIATAMRPEGKPLRAADYLYKPFGRDDLCAAVDHAVERHRVLAVATAASRANRPTRSVGSLQALDAESAAALDGMLAILAMRDVCAYDHACRVADLASSVARALSVRAPVIVTIERAALLHDIGKLAVSEALLTNTAPLDSADLTAVRRFPEIGYEMLKGIWPYLAGTAEIVRGVLEWVDGSGHPRGLQGEAIPLGSRIIAVADTFDTMTHPRPFREARSAFDALEEISRLSGTRFDPRVVEAFLTTMTGDRN